MKPKTEAFCLSNSSHSHNNQIPLPFILSSPNPIHSFLPSPGAHVILDIGKDQDVEFLITRHTPLHIKLARIPSQPQKPAWESGRLNAHNAAISARRHRLPADNELLVRAAAELAVDDAAGDGRAGGDVCAVEAQVDAVVDGAAEGDGAVGVFLQCKRLVGADVDLGPDVAAAGAGEFGDALAVHAEVVAAEGRGGDCYENHFGGWRMGGEVRSSGDIL